MNKKLEEKEINRSLKLIFKSSIFIFIAVIFSKLLTYAYRIIIARYFDPEIYGLFSLGVMVLLFLVAVSSLGLVEGVLRFMSFYRGRKEYIKMRYIFRLALFILFFSSILTGLILFLFSDFISINIFNEPELTIFLRIFSLLIPLYLFLYLFSIVIQAFERIKVQSFILDILENFIKLIFLIFFILWGLNTNSIIFSYSMGVVIAFLVSYGYCKYKIPEIFHKYKLDYLTKKQIRKKLFSYSWPLIFYSILYGILPYIDSFVIGYFKGAFNVGLYNAAVPFAMLLVLFPNLFMRLFFPLVTREFSRKNFKVVKELSKQVEKWILIFNMPLFLMIIIFPGAFINIFFGPEYLSALNSLRILSVGFLFYSMSTILHGLISSIGKTKLILLNISFIALFNLILNMILVPKLGIDGAALATTLSSIILTIIFFLEVKYYTSIVPLKRKMSRIIISAMIPTIILIYIKQFIPINLITIMILGCFFVLIYSLMILITKSLDENDIMILNTIKHKIRT